MVNLKYFRPNCIKKTTKNKKKQQKRVEEKISWNNRNCNTDFSTKDGDKDYRKIGIKITDTPLNYKRGLGLGFI